MTAGGDVPVIIGTHRWDAAVRILGRNAAKPKARRLQAFGG